NWRFNGRNVVTFLRTRWLSTAVSRRHDFFSSRKAPPSFIASLEREMRSCCGGSPRKTFLESVHFSPGPGITLELYRPSRIVNFWLGTAKAFGRCRQFA